LMVMVRFQTIIDGDGALSNYHWWWWCAFKLSLMVMVPKFGWYRPLYRCLNL
jgi:hypothetical protein